MLIYTPASQFRRTDAERNDQALSWARDDRRFFAAGACHVLSWAFLEKYADAGFKPVGLRYHPSPLVNHVYVSDGVRAFDFFGWTTEQELLAESEATAGPEGMERVDISELDLAMFCGAYFCRPPSQFHGDAWARANAYLLQFAAP